MTGTDAQQELRAHLEARRDGELALAALTPKAGVRNLHLEMAELYEQQLDTLNQMECPAAVAPRA